MVFQRFGNAGGARQQIVSPVSNVKQRLGWRRTTTDASPSFRGGRGGYFRGRRGGQVGLFFSLVLQMICSFFVSEYCRKRTRHRGPNAKRLDRAEPPSRYSPTESSTSGNFLEVRLNHCLVFGACHPSARWWRLLVSSLGGSALPKKPLRP